MPARTYRAEYPEYRMRPAPRPRRAGGGPATRVDWDRLGRTVLVIVLFMVLAAYVRPVTNLVDSWRGERIDAARHAELKQENERLTGRLRDLDRPEVLEVEARRQGMVRQGERPYVIRDLDPENRDG